MKLLDNALNKYEKLSVQAKASIWFLICSVLQKGITTITTPIFTRLLTPTEYGKFNVFTSWQGIVSAIVILTLPWGVVEQGLIKFSDSKKKFTSATLGLMTTLLLGWTIIYFIFKDFFNSILSLNTIQVLAMLVIVWTSSVFMFWSINQRIRYHYKRLVALTLIVSILKPLTGIICVLISEDKVTARIIGLALVEFIAYIGLFFGMMGEGKTYFDGSIWIYALKFNLPLIPHYLSQRVLNSADRIMIEKMVSSSAAGIYALAYSLSLLLGFVNTAIQNAFNPWIYQKIKDGKAQDIGRIAYLLMIGVAIINLALIIFAPEVIRIFAPEPYYAAVWVVPPVTMSVFFSFMYGFFANIEFYFEKTGLMSIATMAGAVLNLILNYIFIPIFGYVAAGYTTLACYILYCLAHYIFMNRICKEYLHKTIFNVRIILLLSLVFCSISIVITFTYDFTYIRYSLLAILGLFVYFNKDKVIEVINLLRKGKIA